ncbi:unnamed protein product [Caenorhabditis nigoni]
MRSFIVFSAFLVILAQCGYPVAYPTTPSYVTPPSYPVPKYPSAPTYSAVPAPSISISDETSIYNEEDSQSEFRKRAKARTMKNRKFQRRALQPIRRFQQRKH